MRREIQLTKLCRHCSQEKPRDQFYGDPRNPYWLSPWCKECTRETIRKSKGREGPKLRRRSWSCRERNMLIMAYPNIGNDELGILFGRSPENIASKAHKLGLKKDPEWKRRKYYKNLRRNESDT